MYEEKIKHLSVNLKIINLDLDRIRMRLDETNRSIKNILIEENYSRLTKELKELIDFNRFLLQKHKEKVQEKQEAEEALKSIMQEENKHEIKLIEGEKKLEYLSMTLDQSISFNADHPFYSDPSFIRDLIDGHLKTESYEECARLKSRLEELDQD